jgi:hypothetical protein
MFVQHSVHIDQSVESVMAVLAAGPAEWFARLHDLDRVVVGGRIASVGLRKKITVDVGLPLTIGDRTTIPVTWKAAFIEKLAPVMIGKVELAPVDAQTTELIVCGTYEPPLGQLERQVDEAFMRKVAQRTVIDLAGSMAKRLSAAASARTARRPSV